MELTTDQKEILNEIPGYVRIEMLERYILFYINKYQPSTDSWERGFVSAMIELGIAIQNGWLNDDERFKV